MTYRVESKANLADGPTHPEDVGCPGLREFATAELLAYLPGPFANLWHSVATDALTREDILLGRAERAERDVQGPAVVSRGSVVSPWSLPSLSGGPSRAERVTKVPVLSMYLLPHPSVG